MVPPPTPLPCVQMVYFHQDYNNPPIYLSNVVSQYLDRNTAMNINLSKTVLFLMGFTTKASGPDNYIDLYCK